MESIKITKGTDRSWRITLRDGDGQPATTYDPELDLPGAVLWSGDDQAVLAAPHVEWIDAASGTLALHASPADTAGLPPGKYHVKVTISTSDDRTVEAWRGFLDVESAPGDAAPLKVYGTYEDMLTHAQWLGDQQTIEDQAGFAEQRHLARRWLDGLIVAHAGQRTGHTGLGWGRSLDRGLIDVALDADGLIVTHKVREICTHKAIALVCQSAIGPADRPTAYQQLARQHERRAVELASTLVAEIEDSANGEVYEIALGVGNFGRPT